jgi:hypothetical protein
LRAAIRKLGFDDVDIDQIAAEAIGTGWSAEEVEYFRTHRKDSCGPGWVRTRLRSSKQLAATRQAMKAAKARKERAFTALTAPRTPASPPQRTPEELARISSSIDQVLGPRRVRVTRQVPPDEPLKFDPEAAAAHAAGGTRELKVGT